MFMNPNPYAPEALCSKIEYSYQDLIEAQESGSTILVFVMRIKIEECVIVNIPGCNLEGYIPLEEISIYPFFRPNCEISPAIYSLVGKLVSCKILDLEKRILSRKANMLEAFETLSKKETLEEVFITRLSPNNAYVDVGAGLTGRIHISNITKCRFDQISEVGSLFEKQIIPVKVLLIDELKRFDLSYRAVFKESEENFSQGDVITCKVGNELISPTGVGYYVYVTPNVSGIADSPIPLKYLTEIVGVVHKVTPKGLRIKFLKEV